MQSNEPGVLHLAEAVADGSDIDWTHAESSAQTPDERLVIQQLRRLASVGLAARTQAALWGPLEIRGEVGSGTFGTVHRAWDPRLERDVALKLLRTEGALASVVLKEGRVLARIRHPNVVTVYGADRYDGQVGIWMEFVSGRTLKEIVTEQGPFGAHEAALIGRDLSRALAAVHKQGFLHRDIKAQNVMREAGGRTVLMDFGAGETAATSAEATLRGTPVYLAPEVLAGAPPTVQSDLYSMGVLLFFLVSGEFPVVGASLDAIRERHANGAHRLLRDVRPNLPSAFVRVVDAATAANPADRPGSAGALEGMLDAALSHGEIEDVGVEASGIGYPRPSISAWFWRHAWRLALVAAVFATLAAAGWKRWPVGVNAPAHVTRKSVAILPFRNLTPSGGEDDYFSDGVTEDLVAHLGALRDLRVISGASMRRYRDRTKTEREIGSEVGVATVLDGSVRRSGERVRIVSRLIDAQTGEQLWSESFERELKDVVTMQSEVARKIAVALKGELSLPDEQSLDRNRPQDYEAFTLYMKGRYYWGLRTEDGLNRSVQYFNEAISRYPGYARAYAGLAAAYTSHGTYGILPRVTAFARAREAAEKAVALDHDLAEGHAALGYAQKNKFEWAAAEASFKRTLQLKPGYGTGHHWYSILLTQLGRFPEAQTEIKIALTLDPLSVAANLQLASVLMMARRYEDAIAQYERALQMEPDIAPAYRGIALMYGHQRKFDRAFAAAAKASSATPLATENQELKAAIGYLLAVSGRNTEALEVARGLEERYERTGEAVAGSIAAIYAGLRQTDAALEWLARARATGDPEVGYLKVDPRWDALRGELRFDALLASLGFTTSQP